MIKQAIKRRHPLQRARLRFPLLQRYLLEMQSQPPELEPDKKSGGYTFSPWSKPVGTRRCCEVPKSAQS